MSLGNSGRSPAEQHLHIYIKDLADRETHKNKHVWVFDERQNMKWNSQIMKIILIIVKFMINCFYRSTYSNEMNQNFNFQTLLQNFVNYNIYVIYTNYLEIESQWKILSSFRLLFCLNHPSSKTIFICYVNVYVHVTWRLATFSCSEKMLHLFYQLVPWSQFSWKSYFLTQGKTYPKTSVCVKNYDS